jgi:hypothetical protein
VTNLTVNKFIKANFVKSKKGWNFKEMLNLCFVAHCLVDVMLGCDLVDLLDLCHAPIIDVSGPVLRQN